MQIKRNYRRPDPAGNIIMFKQPRLNDKSVPMKQTVDERDTGYLAYKI